MIRFIGDVHAQYRKYIDIVEDANSQGISTFQVGDLGLDYSLVDKEIPKLSKKYKVDNCCILGNHDWYPKRPIFDLGDWGVYNKNIFFVRGAFSIDWKYQLANGTWFPEEEIPHRDCEKCYNDYCNANTDIVVTHDCPRFIADKIGKPEVLKAFGYDPTNFNTRTSLLFDEMFKARPPKLWIHGHFHRNYEMTVDNTKFKGLGILSYIDI